MQIENSICVAHWKFEMCCTLKMFPRPFPLLRINSLFHLLRIATAAEACSDRVRDKKTAITKKCQLKVSIPKNSTQIINLHLLLFPLHSVAASRRSLLCPSWGVNIAGDSSEFARYNSYFVTRSCCESNWMKLILHYLKSLANPSGPLWTLKAVTCLTGILFLLIVRLTVLQSIEAQQIKCNSSQLIIGIGSQNRLTFSSLLFPTKKCSHVGLV